MRIMCGDASQRGKVSVSVRPCASVFVHINSVYSVHSVCVSVRLCACVCVFWYARLFVGIWVHVNEDGEAPTWCMVLTSSPKVLGCSIEFVADQRITVVRRSRLFHALTSVDCVEFISVKEKTNFE